MNASRQKVKTCFSSGSGAPAVPHLICVDSHKRQRKADRGSSMAVLNFSRRTYIFPGLLLLSMTLFTGFFQGVRAETVQLPMSIDLLLLRNLIVDQAYREPGERARVLVLSEGCNELWLHNPVLSQEQELLRFQTGISITWGTPIAGNCYGALNWQGYLVLRQHPRLDSQWHLTFTTVDSLLLDNSGQPATIAGLLWDLIKDHVHAYLDRISINLVPPVENLKDFMLAQTDDETVSTTRRFLASMHPQQPIIRENKVLIDILAEVESPAVPVAEDEMAAASPEAQARVISLWQSWDALLVHLITQLSGKPLNEIDRQLLLDTMLLVRYEFSDALGNHALTNSFVRNQFIQAWQVLGPLFRRHLVAQTSHNILGYMSFFTAADALTTLDRIGPAIGIDISRNGFYRLAEMLGNGSLDESNSVDPRLREVLGIGMQTVPQEEANSPTEEQTPQDTGGVTLPTGAPVHKPGKEDAEPDLRDSGYHCWLINPGNWPIWQLFGPQEANAAPPTLAEVRSWTAETTHPSELLQRVQKILVAAAKNQQDLLRPTSLPVDWFLRTLLATAWQESCFRQFEIKDNKITYLLSYNNTSVGLMQINEKVWRGIFDLQELRWNIAYNTNAGAQILTIYLNRYIARQEGGLSKTSNTAGRRYLAALLYALYNGGPGQLNKYPIRVKSGKLYQSDTLFLGKYDIIERQDWPTMVDCLPAT